MKDILKLKSNDSTLNNVFKNFPFYIDIKGSVSICQIKCAQEIEQCNEIKFSSMTNHERYLLLNPNKNVDAKCNIKLAFDSNNDTINEEGDAKYKFEKAFITVPSLHRINGKLADLENFLIFSSIQKNGNILYIILCTLSNGTSNVPTDSSKLLNYKLFEELFINSNNSIPEIDGTKPVPDFPIDLTNFIPIKGERSFYDYVNPKNPEVNFRIFQNQLSVSNDCIQQLKEKLTPGNIYSDFSLAITQNINPPNNLFFYFSQDLTKNYESFSINEKNNNMNKQFEDLHKTLYEIDKDKNKKNMVENDDDNEHDNEEEETIDNISKLKKIKFDSFENKEKFVNCCKSSSSSKNNIKIYKIESNNGKVLKIYDNIDSVIELNNNYVIEEIAEAIDNYPYETYKGYYWRIKSQFNLYYNNNENESESCSDDTEGNYELIKEVKEFSSDEEQEFLIEYLVSFINNKKFHHNLTNNEINDKDCTEAFNAMKNFPYEKYGKYYIQNEYVAYQVQITPISKIIIIFSFWAIIIISFLFYRMNYHLLNGNYDKHLNIDNNSILNNDILHSLASIRFRIIFLFVLVIVIGGFYTIGYNLSNLSINSTNIFPIILSFTFLISYFIIGYVCSRIQYGSLNYISTAEEISIPLFLKVNIKDNDTWQNKSWNYIYNVYKLLIYKNSSGSYKLIPELFKCLSLNLDLNKKDNGTSSSILLGGSTDLPGNSVFPNSESSKISSINQINNDSDFSSNINDYAENSFSKTLIYNVFFYSLSYIFKNMIENISLKYNNDTKYNAIIKYFFINDIFYYITTFITIKPSIQYYLNNGLIKFILNNKTITYSFLGFILLALSITFFVFFAIYDKNKVYYLVKAIILLISFIIVICKYFGYLDFISNDLLPILIITLFIVFWFLYMTLVFIVDLFSSNLNTNSAVLIILTLIIQFIFLLIPLIKLFMKTYSTTTDNQNLDDEISKRIPSIFASHTTTSPQLSQEISGHIPSLLTPHQGSHTSTSPQLSEEISDHIPSLLTQHHGAPSSTSPQLSEQISSHVPSLLTPHQGTSASNNEQLSEQISSHLPSLLTPHQGTSASNNEQLSEQISSHIPPLLPTHNNINSDNTNNNAHNTTIISNNEKNKKKKNILQQISDGQKIIKSIKNNINKKTKLNNIKSKKKK